MTLMAPGTYKARACEGALGFTAKGSEQVAVDVMFLEGEGVAGRHMTWYGYFTEKTVDRTIESLRTMGWVGDDISQLDGLGSTEFYAVVDHEPDLNGNLRARIQWINDGGGVALKDRMDSTAAKIFAERLKGHVIAHRQQNGARRPQQQKPVQHQEVQDDDIPF